MAKQPQPELVEVGVELPPWLADLLETTRATMTALSDVVASQARASDLRSLDERMAAVQLELENVPRRGHAEVKKDGVLQYEYDYITEADLMKGVRPLLAKHGIATYYSDEIVSNAGGMATVRVSIVFAANGEQRIVTADGVGTDRGDKGPNKAKTAAVRYLLWKTFLQPSDEDPEQENVSQDEAERAARLRESTAARRATPQATRGKLVERIGQLSLEADEIAGRTPGATLGAIPDLAKVAFDLVEPYPNGASDQELVAIGTQLAQFVAAERARKESDPDAYSPAELEIVKA
jgi:hypothetical protein